MFPSYIREKGYHVRNGVFIDNRFGVKYLIRNQGMLTIFE